LKAESRSLQSLWGSQKSILRDYPGIPRDPDQIYYTSTGQLKGRRHSIDTRRGGAHTSPRSRVFLVSNSRRYNYFVNFPTVDLHQILPRHMPHRHVPERIIENFPFRVISRQNHNIEGVKQVFYSNQLAYSPGNAL